MIPIQFGLWWSGAKLSYLRYLTFKTLRHFHPNAKIELYYGNLFAKSGHQWNVEKQDFEHPDSIKNDYFNALKDLNVTVRDCNLFPQYQSNFQSDLFRWYWLHTNGGFYLDTDQIILKPFDALPLDNDFIYSGYEAVSCGYYTPVGVIGASKESEIADVMMQMVPRLIDPNNYNSAGPFGFRRVLESSEWKDKIFNSPSHYFYPLSESYKVLEIYDGNIEIPNDSYALHWYGGHPTSQEFNKIYNKEFAQTSNDTISKFLREKDLL